MKKTIAILLALLLVAPAAVSCAGDTEKPETDFASESTDAATETTVETERTRQNTPDTLPDTLDFAGAEIHILHENSDKHQEELYVEEDTGDVLDAAIYTRNLNVEERLNVKIVPIAGEPSVDAKTAVTAGVDEYHIVAGKQWQMMSSPRRATTSISMTLTISISSSRGGRRNSSMPRQSARTDSII